MYLTGWEDHFFFRSKTPGFDGEDFIVHKYPYKSFPLFQSHLRPQFVIFDSGRKLKKLEAAVLKKLADDIPSLLNVVQLYSAWMEPPGGEVQDMDLSYQPPSNLPLLSRLVVIVVVLLMMRRTQTMSPSGTVGVQKSGNHHTKLVSKARERKRYHLIVKSIYFLR